MQQYSATDPDFVDTYDAYSNTLFIGNSNVLIPYINLGLMPGNPINEKQTVMDFGYYLFEEVDILYFGAQRTSFSIQLSDHVNAPLEEYFSFGLHDGAEVKVLCTGLRLFLPDDSRIRTYHEPFVPIDTGSPYANYQQNIDSMKATAFFDGHALPKELKQFLGSPVQMLTWIGDGMKMGYL